MENRYKGMKENLVSIITPMYNSKGTISQAIESVLNQSYKEWEMIIVDDCSCDGSIDIINVYAKKDNRIRYFIHKKNLGVARTRNNAINQAKGRYLAFLDSDDIWKADKLEKQIGYMKEMQAFFSYSACEIINKNGETIGKVRNVPEKTSYKKLLRGNVIPCLTVVLDRSKINKVEMPDIPHEDYATWLDILKQGGIAHGINEVLAEYRISSDSVSGNKWRAMKWTWNIYRRHQELDFFKSSYYFICYVITSLRKR